MKVCRFLFRLQSVVGKWHEKRVPVGRFDILHTEGSDLRSPQPGSLLLKCSKAGITSILKMRLKQKH